ncbi:MAG: response regulator [Myxococcales bacterium]
MVIDDDPDVLRATTRILREAGYQVIPGASASDAIALTHRHLPVMLLLDVVLLDGDGTEVARQLKLEPALAGVFVVLLSGARKRVRWDRTSTHGMATSAQGPHDMSS